MAEVLAAPSAAAPAAAPAAPAVAPSAPAAAPAAPAPGASGQAAAPAAGAAAPAAQTGSLLEQAASGEAPKPGEAAKPGDVAAKAGAPESYTDFTLPEGISPDAKLMDSFKATAKELGLSQDAAQKLVSLQAEHAKSTAETLVSQAEQQRAAQISAWQAETKKSLGAEWQKELGYAAKALDAFWPPEFRQMLTASGLGDHPLMAKGLVELGKRMSETKPGEGSRAGITDPKEASNRQMFPKMYDASGNYIGGPK